MITTALARYDQRAEAINSLLCVGLDSKIDRLPARFLNKPYPQFAFNRWIIEQTHWFASAYKPNIAFYEAEGTRGLTALDMTMEYLREQHPDIYTICDAKRGDIGSTNEGYVHAIFDRLGFDAITLHPYLGREALAPFLGRRDKGCIILCRTSNPGAGELQDLMAGGQPLWRAVAEKVSTDWNEEGNCMLVVGATYPDELREVRRVVGDMTILVPGVGTQGGAVEQAVSAGINSQGRGLIINVARSVIFADDPGAAAEHYCNEINRYRGA